MPDVVGVGENSVDLVYRVAGRTAGASKLPILDRATRCGGQVATTMATCAALGLKAGYIGAFGNDENGRRMRLALRRRGVDVRNAVVRRAANRYAVILVDERGDRIVLWQRDQALNLRRSEVERAIVGAGWVHVDATDLEAAMTAVALARTRRIPTSCDVDAATRATRALVRAVDVAILAEGVPEALTGERRLESALRALRTRRHTALAVTLGARGSAMLYGDRYYRVPAFPVNAVDATGAGDVFRGALIYAMLKGFEPKAMLRFANAAAALSVTRSGALDGVPTLAETMRLFTASGAGIPAGAR
jgi:sugar/nucleoside kinase (ribokinase family)